MAVTTVNIPLTTLTVGEHDFPPTGGQAVDDTVTSAVLSIDRTVTNGFNSQPATTTAKIDVLQSNDNGGTWVTCGSEEIDGGIYTNPHTGTQVNTSTVGVALFPGTGRLMKAAITVAGASVAVAGTLTIQ